MAEPLPGVGTTAADTDGTLDVVSLVDAAPIRLGTAPAGSPVAPSAGGDGELSSPTSCGTSAGGTDHDASGADGQPPRGGPAPPGPEFGPIIGSECNSDTAGKL
jgi:hypothetical protein